VLGFFIQFGVKLTEPCWERGVFVRPIGDNIAFCPPLIAEKEHLDEIFGVTAEVVRELS
jgi:adenosylmethionine-8-amino-7-oxononanoate aminotransferase